MKFKGQPNLLVRISKPIRGEVKCFQFDDNGFYETESATTIKRLKQTFEEVKEVKEIEEIKEVQKVEEVTIQPNKEIYSCKKCDFTTDNKGYLMAHYREHKKEG